MLTISVKADFSRVHALLTGMHRQIPFATAKALTKTAQIARSDLQAEMKRVFDRPTRFALNSVFIKPATKQNLQAEVWLKGEYPGDPNRSFMRPQIFGGDRPQKKFERLLQRARVLPEGWVTIPGKAAKLDAYGNQQRGELVQILSALHAFPQGGVGYSMNRTQRSVKRRGPKLRDLFFSSPSLQQQAPNSGRLPWGVWERKPGGRVQCLLFFVRRAVYRKRLAFFEVTQRTFNREFQRQFEIAFREAVATAR